MLVDLEISRKICKTDVVAVNAGVEGMGVIPAVIGNIGLLYPPMMLQHHHHHQHHPSLFSCPDESLTAQ